jgi:hypothetical protein
MLDWLKPKPKAPDRLVKLLAEYPPFTPLHLGRNGACGKDELPLLTREQCFENLNQYKAAIAGRLPVLRSALAGLGINMDDAYTAPSKFVTALHRTLIVELPPLYRRELFRSSNYELSNRAGDDVGLSFMGDLAMLEADVLTKAQPGCFIGLNLDNKDRTMRMYRRPCLLGLIDSLFPEHLQPFDLEALWFSYFANMDHPSRLTNPLIIPPSDNAGVIGGWMLIRLNRFIVAPNLDELKRTTWLGKAA